MDYSRAIRHPRPKAKAFVTLKNTNGILYQLTKVRGEELFHISGFFVITASLTARKIPGHYEIMTVFFLTVGIDLFLLRTALKQLLRCFFIIKLSYRRSSVKLALIKWIIDDQTIKVFFI